MKKTLLIATFAISLLLSSTPLALASSSSSTVDNSTFYYQPLSVWVQLNSTSFSPNGIPYCGSTFFALICYGPSFIRTAYNFPSTLDGTGQTILIVDAYGSPTIQNDLSHFDTLFGISPPPSFTILCPTGCPSKTLVGSRDFFHSPLDWAFETSLDVEYAHAIAPGANIVLVVASTDSGNDINAAEAKAIQLYPGSIMSQSFGLPEYFIQGNNLQVLQAEKNYAAAAAAGITVFAAAGDNGASNGASFANALFPASDPLVTAVGGTEGNPYIPFTDAQTCSGTCSAGLVTVSGTCSTGHIFVSPCTPVGYGGEQVWNEPAFGPFRTATGGAPSLLFGVPSYQNSLGLSSRATPDVAYNAAIDGGVLVFTSFTGFNAFSLFGGTSAGSPQWAAIAALANQAAGHPLGFLNPAIYAIGHDSTKYANDFHDITVGNNRLDGSPVGFQAGTGWDDASGWGTPNVANLIPDLVAHA